MNFFNATVSFILQLQCILTINIWYSSYHELFIVLFGIEQPLFVKIRYVGGSPLPPQIGVIVGLYFVGGVGSELSRGY